MATLDIDAWALRSLSLDSADQFVPDIIANANDADGRGIDLHVTQGGTAASMAGMSVYLAWRHSNGNQGLTEFTAVSAETGHYRVYYPAGMMHAGEVLARIAIYVGESTPITGSRDFHIFVEQNPINEDEALNNDDFSAFGRAVIDLNELEGQIQAAEAARVSAEASRVSEEQSRDSEFSGMRTQMQSATNAASNATASANGAADNANTAANTALQIANAVSQAGDSDIAAINSSIEELGHQVAELSESYLLVGTTVCAPSSKASVSGSTVTLPTSSISGSTIILS